MTKKVELCRKSAVALGALVGYLRPKLAKDVKVDFYPAFAGVTNKNFKAKCPDIVEALGVALDGKLNENVEANDVSELLMALDAEAACYEPKAGPKGAADDDDEEKKDKAEDDEFADVDEEKEADPGPENVNKSMKAKDKKKAKDMKAEEEMPKGNDEMVSVSAMDQAIKAAVAAVERKQRDKQEAYQAVRPHVGELAMDHESAADIYADALSILGVKTKGVHPSAYPTLLELAGTNRASKSPRRTEIAADAALVGSFDQMYPDAARIKVIG